MTRRPLRLPALLAVTSIALGACTIEPPVDDAVDVVDATMAPDCPSPTACVLDFTREGDGSIVVIYLRDGEVSDVPCPAPPTGCAVA